MSSIFSCAHLYNLEKCLFNFFAHFLAGLSFLLLNCKYIIYILDNTPLSDMQFANIIFHSVSCLFPILVISYDAYKFYIYIYIYIYIYVYVCMCVCIYIYIYVSLAATPHGMWDLRSLTRDQTCAPCIGSVES